MVVKNVTNGLYQVDLLVSSSDRNLTSIIDILIHTCSNALSNSSSDSLNSVQKKVNGMSGKQREGHDCLMAVNFYFSFL